MDSTTGGVPYNTPNGTIVASLQYEDADKNLPVTKRRRYWSVKLPGLTEPVKVAFDDLQNYIESFRAPGGWVTPEV